MKLFYLIGAFIAAVNYGFHAHDHAADMQGLHYIAIWAGFLIAGSVS